MGPAQGAGATAELALARHLQAHGKAASLPDGEPGEALVAVYLGHEGLEAHERAKEHGELAVRDAALRRLDHVGVAAEAAHEGGLAGGERAHGDKLLRDVHGVRAARGLGEHVAGPDALGAGNPHAALAAHHHAQQLKGVGDEARAQRTGARRPRPARRAQDEVGLVALIGCEGSFWVWRLPELG